MRARGDAIRAKRAHAKYVEIVKRGVLHGHC